MATRKNNTEEKTAIDLAREAQADHIEMVRREAEQVHAMLQERHPDMLVLKHEYRPGVIGFTITTDRDSHIIVSRRQDNQHGEDAPSEG